MQGIVETTAQRVVRLLQRRGLVEQDGVDPLWDEEPLLASLTGASVQGRVAIGDRRGERVRRRLMDPEEGVQTGPLRQPAWPRPTAVAELTSIRHYLEGVGLPARAPPIAPATPHAQPEFEYAAG